MSLLGNIVSKILHPFGGGSAEAAPSSSQSTTSSGGASSTPAPTGSAGTSGASGGQSMDVAAVLDDLASKNPQKLDWKHSIVDLMKLLDLDSGLASRKQLADELHYTGDKEDSASMNIWLHKQVMHKLAENGGKVPDDLKH